MNDLSEVKTTMGAVAQFCLDNMNKPVTTAVQAEFNILYNQYHQALKQAEKDGISERDAIVMGTQCPVEIPDDVYDLFESWFSQRLRIMVATETIGFTSN